MFICEFEVFHRVVSFRVIRWRDFDVVGALRILHHLVVRCSVHCMPLYVRRVRVFPHGILIVTQFASVVLICVWLVCACFGLDRLRVVCIIDLLESGFTIFLCFALCFFEHFANLFVWCNANTYVAAHVGLHIGGFEIICVDLCFGPRVLFWFNCISSLLFLRCLGRWQLFGILLAECNFICSICAVSWHPMSFLMISIDSLQVGNLQKLQSLYVPMVLLLRVLRRLEVRAVKSLHPCETIVVLVFFFHGYLEHRGARLGQLHMVPANADRLTGFLGWWFATMPNRHLLPSTTYEIQRTCILAAFAWQFNCCFAQFGLCLKTSGLTCMRPNKSECCLDWVCWTGPICCFTARAQQHSLFLQVSTSTLAGIGASTILNMFLVLATPGKGSWQPTHVGK